MFIVRLLVVLSIANSTIEDCNASVKQLQEEQKDAEMQGQVGR